MHPVIQEATTRSEGGEVELYTLDEVMADHDPSPFYAYTADGEQIALPSSVGGIRRALPAELGAAFERAVEVTPAQDLYAELAGWAVKTRPDLVAEDEAVFRRLEREDFSGFTPAARPGP